MIATTVTAAGLTCSTDAECRRNVCISQACAPRPLTGGKCDSNNQCFYTSSESCILSKCATRSNLEGPCEEVADCSSSDAVCTGNSCLLPLDKDCSKNSECISSLSCILSKCATRSDLEGPCEEPADCSSSDAVCEATKCLLPLDKDCSKNSECISSLTCLNDVCAARSDLEGPCEEVADCSSSDAVCSGNNCLLPLDKSCSKNSECVPPLICINDVCADKSDNGEDCDETADCVSSTDQCAGDKCTFNAALLVWDGNNAPSVSSIYSASAAVGSVLYTFEATFDEVFVEAYNTLTNTWTSKTGPGFYSYGFSVVALGTRIFLVGGSVTINDVLTTFISYDTQTNSWNTAWTQLPEPRSFAGVAAAYSSVFVFGGSAVGGARYNTIRYFDTSNPSGQWFISSSSFLPQATTSLSATTVGSNTIYLAGGSAASGALSTVLKYNVFDPTSPPVSSGTASMNQPRVNPFFFYHSPSNRLYVAGGLTSGDQGSVEYLNLASPSGPWVSANAPNFIEGLQNNRGGGLINNRFYFPFLQSLQVLDVSVPAGVKWTPLPNIPARYTTVYQMTSSNTITAVDTYYYQGVYSFNTATNSWSTASSASNFPSLIDNPTSAAIGGELFVMGGIDDGSQVTAAVRSFKSGSWADEENIPAERVGGCAAVSGNDIYLYGGLDSILDPTSTLYKMDTTQLPGSQWTTITPVSGSATAVGYCAAVIVNGKLLIFGGGTENEGSSPTDLIQTYDIATNKWEAPLSGVITARAGLSAVFFKGLVFVSGGSETEDGLYTPGLSKIEAFNVNSKTASAVVDMPTPRYYHGLVTDGTSIFALGGKSLDNPLSSLEKLHLP